MQLTFDEQKTHHDPVRPAKATQLRSATPQGVVHEFFALSHGHYVTRADGPSGGDDATGSGLVVVRGLSAKLEMSLSGVRQPATAKLARVVRSVAVGVELRSVDLQQTPTGPQGRNRTNPRVIKRKMSNLKKKRPQHRNRPPLSITFVESVVIRE